MVLGDLGASLTKALSKLNSSEIVDEKTIKILVNDVARALLAADVNVQLIQQLNINITDSISSLKDNLCNKFTIKRCIEKMIVEEMTKLLSTKIEIKPPKRKRLNIIICIGLQGSGKTTTCVKLAYYYRNRGWKVGIICADTTRQSGPFDQLKQNAFKVKVPLYGERDQNDAIIIASNGIKSFKQKAFEIIIIDTNGNHKDINTLFLEMQSMSNTIHPHHTALVLDSTIGQAAQTQTGAFKSKFPDGAVIITKLDGHCKGAGALAAVSKTGLPVTFLGIGEHINDLEKFNGKRFIQRMLGRGDIETLVERVREYKMDDQRGLLASMKKGGMRVCRDRPIMPQQYGKMANMMPQGFLKQIGGQQGFNNLMQKFQGSTCAVKKMNDKIGFSVGGAMDCGKFRDNIKNNVMPCKADISYEGIYNEYYFDTNSNEHGDDMRNEDEGKIDTQNDKYLFYPSYCYSISKKPIALLMEKQIKRLSINDIDEEREIFMTVGLNSNISAKDFKRKKLNLVILLDISGSMNHTFKHNKSVSKIGASCKAIDGLIKHLNDDDKIGLVVFNNQGKVIWKLRFLNEFSKNHQIRNGVHFQAKGGTNFEDGYRKCIDVFQRNIKKWNENNDKGLNPKEYDNRVIVFTDMCPNMGETATSSLMNMIEHCAVRKINKIYTTFIGIGLDFNVELVSKITTIRGANYFSIHSNKQFMKKIDEEFDYMVSPLVFNLKLMLKSEGNQAYIDQVYGSNANNHRLKTKGEVMNINTLFPSPVNNDGDTKGGIVLLKIKGKKNNTSFNMVIECEYEDKFGKKYLNKQIVGFSNDYRNDIDYYDNNGIQKAILLMRYVSLIKSWIQNSNKSYRSGICVSNDYQNIFKEFYVYFGKQAQLINDKSLKKEIDILKMLSSAKSVMESGSTNNYHKPHSSNNSYGFTLSMFRDQIQNILKFGSCGAIMRMIPGLNILENETEKEQQEKLKRFMVMMDSMTLDELDSNISVIENDYSRTKRVCYGSGLNSVHLNELIACYKSFASACNKMHYSYPY